MTKEELKQWRETNNLTQQQLADLLNVTQVTVARWETDVRKIPSFLYLALIGLEKSKRKGGEKGYGVRKKKKGKVGN